MYFKMLNLQVYKLELQVYCIWGKWYDKIYKNLYNHGVYMNYKNRIRIRSLRELPVFWKTFMMLLCVLIFALIFSFANSYLYRKVLTKSYLHQTEITLENNVRTMSSALYATYAIPKGIESARYYNYIQTAGPGELSNEYLPILSFMRAALGNQIYLYNQCEECILYFSNVNSIVTRYNCFQRAEDCFTDYISLSETNPQEIKELLQKKGILTMLPMQDVSIGKSTMRCLPLFVRPVDSSITVLTLFSEDAILDFLGVKELPEGTRMQIHDFQGQLISVWPHSVKETVSEKCYEVQVEDMVLHCTVTLFIPQSYFAEQMENTQLVNYLLYVVTALLGVTISVFFSSQAAKPWRELLFFHGQSENESDVQDKSEVIYISNILEKRRDETSNLRGMLFSGMLIRAMSGSVLSEQEEKQLEIYLKNLGWPCQLALIHSDENIELLLTQMKELQGEYFICQPISMNEIGILFFEKEVSRDIFVPFLQNIIETFPEQQLLCGVSAPMEQVSDFGKAVRQARMAMPKESGVQIYFASLNQKKNGLSWLMHERFYQSILSFDEEAVLRLLKQIAEEHYRGVAAREAYYNICFILRSAANEFGVELQELNIAEYDFQLLAQENILKLEKVVCVLLQKIRQQKELTLSVDELQTKVKVYLDTHFTEANICAASIAENCGTSEKKVYQITRETTGQSLNEYIVFLRMELAGKLLCSLDINMNEVAARCGYDVESTFYRVFKKYYKITPAQYRKRGGLRQE